jgi:hypothetical protein
MTDSMIEVGALVLGGEIAEPLIAVVAFCLQLAGLA